MIWPRTRATLPIVVAIAAALGMVLAISGSGHATDAQPVLGTLAPIAPHPRIFLDPATLARLRAGAAASSPEWQALKARCDAFLTGTVEWPDGNNYPDSNSIGAGYQGDGYLPALMDLGLCYQTGADRGRTTGIGICGQGSRRPR